MGDYGINILYKSLKLKHNYFGDIWAPYIFWGHFGREHLDGDILGGDILYPLTLFGDIMGGDILCGDILGWIQ